MNAKYCSQCGIKMVEFARTCAICGHRCYENPVPLVLCVLLAENRTLLVKRDLSPYKGKWAPPGGFIDCGETIEDAALREVQEETGIVLTEEMLIPYSISSIPTMNQIYIVFRVHLETMRTAVPGPEVLDACWFRENEMPKSEFWLPAHYKSLTSIFESLRTGKFKFYLTQSSNKGSTGRSHYFSDHEANSDQ